MDAYFIFDFIRNCGVVGIFGLLPEPEESPILLYTVLCNWTRFGGSCRRRRRRFAERVLHCWILPDADVDPSVLGNYQRVVCCDCWVPRGHAHDSLKPLILSLPASLVHQIARIIPHILVKINSNQSIFFVPI